MARRKSGKPIVTTKCPANAKAGPDETIIEFSFPQGGGGLISFRQGVIGALVEVYRVDQGIVVTASRTEATVLAATTSHGG